MSTDIGIRFGAQGERETRTAIQAVNAQIRSLNSEMKSVVQAFTGMEESEEAITAKSSTLQRSISAQEQKISLLGNQYEKAQDKLQELTKELDQANEQFGENSKEAAKAQNAYNRQVASVNKLSAEMNSANADLMRMQRELNNVGQAAGGAGNALAGLGNDAQKAGEDTAQMADSLADVVKKAALGAAGLEAAIKAFAISDDITASMNKFRAATGVTREETEAMGESMKEIYNSNLGESFEDIAGAMELVKQKTKQSGEELENTTKYALTLRDTFDIDINEGIRGADILMKKFGLTAEEAYTYIANGAQQGLNQNQDLADQIAEYAVYYAEMGMSVDDMFNAMAAGAESGVFQIDYLNDAIKEFGIISKDASDGTKEAFTSLGLDANQLTKDFANGGETAFKAYGQVAQALLDLDDKTKQNTIGVALFGTKWEDLGVAAMESLVSANNEIDFTKNSLESINEIRYDSFGAALEGIKRQVETCILAPIGQQATPALTVFSQGLQVAVDRAGDIAPVATAGATAIVTFTAAMKAQTVATNMAAAATKALHLVMDANPAIKVITVIAALTAAVVTAYKTNETFRNGVNQTWQSFKDGAATVSNGVKTIKNVVIKEFKELPSTMKKAGWDTINGLLAGITGGAGDVVRSIGNLGDRAVAAFKNKLGIHSPSLVFKAIGQNIIEGLNIGIDDKAGMTIAQIISLGDAISNTGNAISTGIITTNIQTGEKIYSSLYKNVMRRLNLYSKERNERITAMQEATTDNIAAIQKEVDATRTATDAKIKLYQQEYAAKMALIDDETNAATKAIQAQIDAINNQQEQENRQEEELNHIRKMQELQEAYNNAATSEERYQIEQKMAEEERNRKKQLLQQERQDKIESLRDEMEAIREQANEKKAALQEELEAKQYQLEQQRIKEIEYMQQVIALMQEQVDKKKELEEVQTQIVAKEKELQTKKMDAETKKQTQADLAKLKEQEKNLKESLATNEKTMKEFLPTIQNISNQYGEAFLSGFKSTEGQIKSYLSSMASFAKSQLSNITASFAATKGIFVNGSHATGLSYVPFDGYIAQLHKGERVLTAYENRVYSAGSGDVQNVFHVQAVVREEADIKRIAEELYHLQRNDARGKGVVFV